ncbi:MAG: AbrB/MazE/SpoVT family DNA-binding domain-containing protein [Alphaproteobacteria bacterium]|nr:MAG: AbrB/MazE/SpoVT family DNA-binding domain-containing protein [Alphaproteobacteria bacterium]TMJ43074.1 MAG: AbrB/MazE/SpoVT family DNA-binding domain-containing protein [Alphaproteobacteria bacterium]
MQVAKWGNSLAVRLPRKLVDEMKLKAGDEIEVVKAEGREVAIEKIDKREQFLKAMEQFHWPVPEGYKFDRDEANER